MFTFFCAVRAGVSKRRINRELGLQLRNKTAEAAGQGEALRKDRRNATLPNECWAMAFVHDQLATGRKLCVLTIVDTLLRFTPALEPRLFFRGGDVVEASEGGRARDGTTGRDPG